MFQVDVMSRTPIYEQFVNQVEQYILAGLLNEGDRIASVRTLSMELSVNPNTIQKALSELDRRGLITSVPGKGCFIAESAKSILAASKRGNLAALKEKLLEFKLAGISKSEIIACVGEVFVEEDLEK